MIFSMDMCFKFDQSLGAGEMALKSASAGAWILRELDEILS